MWDVSGAQRYASLLPLYVRGALLAVLVFDVSNAASFEHLASCLAQCDVSTQIIVVGNKADMPHDEALAQRAIVWCRERAYTYIEVTATQQASVDRLLHVIVECIVNGPVSTCASRSCVTACGARVCAVE